MLRHIARLQKARPTKSLALIKDGFQNPRLRPTNVGEPYKS